MCSAPSPLDLGVCYSFVPSELVVFLGGYVVLSALSSGFGLFSLRSSNKETLCFRTHVALNQKQKQANVDNHCVSSSVSVFGRAAGYTFLNSVSLFWRASLQKCPRGPWPFSLQFLYRETKTWLLLGPFSGAQFWDGVPFFSCSVSGHLFK